MMATLKTPSPNPKATHFHVIVHIHDYLYIPHTRRNIVAPPLLHRADS
jgi:hypothetical protein